MDVPRFALLTLAVCCGSHAADEPKRYKLPLNCMTAELGRCYNAHFDFGEEGDRNTHNQSQLLLFEDGQPLGPAHALHADIREKAGGRYSHWTREGLYFSASDGSDPRTNGRVYEVASTNPDSTLGGLLDIPFERRERVETIIDSHHTYAIPMAGTLDLDHTLTLSSGNCVVGFQSNEELVIANTGDTPVINPRVVINDRGDWSTFDRLLTEFTRGAASEADKAYLIFQQMRSNLYHAWPLYAHNEPHDPVRLLGIYGFNLCDDAGSAGCTMFLGAGLRGSKNRGLHGHVQCEANVDGKLWFMDIDMDCFYLDRENEQPVSGNEVARDHDLAHRELNYGPVIGQFQPSDAPGALFGPDDKLYDADHRGHTLGYTLRPGEQVVFRWDSLNKHGGQDETYGKPPLYYANSKFVYHPKLDPAATEPALVYPIEVPYLIVGGQAQATFAGQAAADTCALSISLDGQDWQQVWSAKGAGEHQAEVNYDEQLKVTRDPPKRHYLLRAEVQGTAKLTDLTITTDIMAAPLALPRLRLGENQVVYSDDTEGPHQVAITHRWKESSAVTPPPAPETPEFPQPNAAVAESILSYRWPEAAGAKRYHLQVSRRPDFAWPYRTSLDVIVPTNSYVVPLTGIYSPDVTYYWRLRSQDARGVWGPWSGTWRFTWDGPRVPVSVTAQVAEGRANLSWEPNPNGPRPVKYRVYGCNEKGFSIADGEHQVFGLGKQPPNFVIETTETSLQVAGTGAIEGGQQVFWRVVAVDAKGVLSGPSDYAELPHPWFTTAAATEAKVGQAYRYQAGSLASIGDCQNRPPHGGAGAAYVYQFFDQETNEFSLKQGPAWLKVEATSGLLSGTPPAGSAGKQQVEIEVTNQFGGSASQVFELVVAE